VRARVTDDGLASEAHTLTAAVLHVCGILAVAARTLTPAESPRAVTVAAAVQRLQSRAACELLALDSSLRYERPCSLSYVCWYFAAAACVLGSTGQHAPCAHSERGQLIASLIAARWWHCTHRLRLIIAASMTAAASPSAKVVCVSVHNLSLQESIASVEQYLGGVCQQYQVASLTVTRRKTQRNNSFTAQHRGRAVVQFADEAQAREALQKISGLTFAGQHLQVLHLCYMRRWLMVRADCNRWHCGRPHCSAFSSRRLRLQPCLQQRPVQAPPRRAMDHPQRVLRTAGGWAAT
jgi:hypothetical protein